MQAIRCKLQQCSFCSSNGFCLNRLVVIDNRGVCSKFKQGYIEPWEKSNYFPIEEQEQVREPVRELLEASKKEEGDGPPRD